MGTPYTDFFASKAEFWHFFVDSQGAVVYNHSMFVQKE